MNISIHRPTQNDIEELQQLFSIVISDTFEKEGLQDSIEFINSEILDKKEFLQVDLETNGSKRFFLIAKYQKKIVGTIGFGPSGDTIKECSKGKYSELGEIGTLFVLPEYQNKGIGTILLNSMYLTLVGKNIKEFTLDSGYTIAKKIWSKKLGEPNIIMKDYWGVGYDHLIWYRRIEDMTIGFQV